MQINPLIKTKTKPREGDRQRKTKLGYEGAIAWQSLGTELHIHDRGRRILFYNENKQVWQDVL